MSRLSIILFLTLLASVLVQADGTWSWIWRKEADNPQLDRGTGTKPCTNINHQKGLLFEFDGGDAYVCLLMYGEKDCQGGISGYACSIYNKKASGDILSYRVVGGDFAQDPSIISTTTMSMSESTTTSETSSTSTSSETSTSTSTSIGTTLTTSAASPSDAATDAATAPSSEPGDGGGHDSSLSGGAIAGIVIGVVAGIVVGAIITLLLLRRRNKNDAPEPSTGPSPFAGAKPAVKAPPSYQAEQPVVEYKAQHEPPQSNVPKWGGSPISPLEPQEPGPEPYTTRPPPGTSLVELSGSHQLVELDASDQRER